MFKGCHLLVFSLKKRSEKNPTLYVLLIKKKISKLLEKEITLNDFRLYYDFETIKVFLNIYQYAKQIKFGVHVDFLLYCNAFSFKLLFL